MHHNRWSKEMGPVRGGYFSYRNWNLGNKGGMHRARTATVPGQPASELDRLTTSTGFVETGPDYFTFSIAEQGKPVESGCAYLAIRARTVCSAPCLALLMDGLGCCQYVPLPVQDVRKRKSKLLRFGSGALYSPEAVGPGDGICHNQQVDFEQL